MCHLAILKQTTILNILNVVIMKRMTYASYMQFYENVDMNMLWSICHRGGKKGCHDNEFENDATATYQFRQLMEIPVQKEVWRERVMQDGGVIPDFGFPQDGGMANKEERAKTTQTRRKIGCISYNTCICPRASSRGYTFEACIFGTDQVWCSSGTRRSRDGHSGSSGTRPW